jgi:dTDP-4-amino-4,6-dideoxygalactose transaminase
VSIQLFVPTFRIDECLAQIRECMEKGWTGLGFKTVEFEEAWKAYTGARSAHFLSSNTVGLQLAIEVLKRRLNWESGDEIITTPLTFVSSNHSILHNAMRPVFADVDASLCLDPASVKERISAKTRAVMFVGMGGNPGAYADVLRICREQGLAMILDAAHMAGTRVDGVHAGNDADATIFSFQAVKNLPTADSGMISFSRTVDDAEVRKLTWLGINKDTYTRTTSDGAYKWLYDVEYVGHKFHGNSIMAGIGLAQLKYLDQDNSFRRQLVDWYRTRLTGAPAVRLIRHAANVESATHLFQLRVANRNELMLALNKHEVFPGVHYRDNTEYSMYRYAKGTCPEAARASEELISLPLHLRMTKEDVDRVSDLVLRYAR